MNGPHDDYDFVPRLTAGEFFDILGTVMGIGLGLAFLGGIL